MLMTKSFMNLGMNLLKMTFTLEGHTVSVYQIVIYFICAGVLIYFIKKIFDV